MIDEKRGSIVPATLAMAASQIDMDGDGIKTATGWIKADDGMLVLDRNGNGLIDSGRELFGDSTILTRGPRAGQTAANGYEALADLDINGDGAINSLDAAYASLRIWQDANQDGISQASNAFSPAVLGVVYINIVCSSPLAADSFNTRFSCKYAKQVKRSNVRLRIRNHLLIPTYTKKLES